jgi:glycosyltransferase involved in cell wall biosynthesis
MDKKVLVLTADLKCTGGVSNYYSALGLQKETWVDYFFVNDPDNTSLLRKIFRLFIRYPYYLSKLFYYDAILLNVSLNFKSYYRDMIYLLFAKIYRKKTIVFFHGWEFDFEKKIRKSFLQLWLFNISYAKMNHGIVLSQIFKKSIHELGLPITTPVDIFSTFADDTYLSYIDIHEKIKSLSNSPLSILFLSRILKAKGIFIAIDAFHILQLKNPDIRINLLIAGDGQDLNDVKNYVTEKKINDVFFLGYLRDYDKHLILNNSHIFLFPSYYPEGMPSVNLEAMLYGMPVITRYNAGTADVVENGVNGFLTDSKDPKIFAEFLQKFIDQHNLLSDIALKNHEKAKNYYTSSIIRLKMLSLFKDVIGHA